MNEVTEKNQLQVASIANGAMTVSEMSAQIQLIQQHMSQNMLKDTHYGVVPGCGSKPTLLKAGAEKLAFIFRLAPSFEIDLVEMQNGHREYRVKCTLTHQLSGNLIAQGVGSCSTLESKYRYISVADYEVLGDCPADYRDNKASYNAQGQYAKQIDGVWKLTKKSKSESKIERKDIADVYNTVLKMAKKRAQVDATLSGTAASDIFTQDLEDLPDDMTKKMSRTEAPKKTEVKKDFNINQKVGFGKHKEKTWQDVEMGFLEWCISNLDKGSDRLEFAQQAYELRVGAFGESTTDNIDPAIQVADSDYPY